MKISVSNVATKLLLIKCYDNNMVKSPLAGSTIHWFTNKQKRFTGGRLRLASYPAEYLLYFQHTAANKLHNYIRAIRNLANLKDKEGLNPSVHQKSFKESILDVIRL